MVYRIEPAKPMAQFICENAKDYGSMNLNLMSVKVEHRKMKMTLTHLNPFPPALCGPCEICGNVHCVRKGELSSNFICVAAGMGEGSRGGCFINL